MTARATARKEVKEELGYPVRTVLHLGKIRPETALLAAELDVFWTELGRGPRKDEPEPKEAFGPLERLTFRELGERIKSGEIRDGCTISALMLAQLAGVMQPLVARPTDRFGESEQEKSTETGEPAKSLGSAESLPFSEPE